MNLERENKLTLYTYLIFICILASLAGSTFRMRDARQDLESIKQELVEAKKENEILNISLGEYAAENLEKDNIIQMQNATTEGLIWQLQTGGSQDE